MDSVFGIGLPELVFILLLAGIVMGPQRIRLVARWLGVMTVKMQRLSRSFLRNINAELDSLDEGGELRGAVEDIQELQRQVADLRQEVARTALGTVKEGKTAVSLRTPQGNTIAPPNLLANANIQGAKRVPPPTPAIPTATSTAMPTPSISLPKALDIPDDP